MKKLIVIVFCCFFLCCRDSSDKENGTGENLTTVTIVPQEPFPVAKFIEDIRVLPLESDGKHLIGAVDNLLFTRERIVVSDQRLSKCVYNSIMTEKSKRLSTDRAGGRESIFHRLTRL